MGTRSFFAYKISHIHQKHTHSLNVFNFNIIILISYNLRDLLRCDYDSIVDETISKRAVRGSKFATALRAGQTLLSTLYTMLYTINEKNDGPKRNR